jgi:hypothetical protein
MDVDGDFDSQLLQQFSSMATTDREVLIAEFQRLLGNQLSDAGCAFFLDMNNWNLQAAICSYFEYDQAALKAPQMSFVKDITIGEGESITPNTKFTKTWRLQNSGDEPWPTGCSLRFVTGELFGPNDSVSVQALLPGEMVDISIEMISPIETGIHQGQWRMCTTSGLYFGEQIWVILQVEEGGVLAVTQLLSHFGSEFSPSAAHHAATHNPFTSPSLCDTGGGCTGGIDVLPSMPAVSGGHRHSSLPSSPRWFGDGSASSSNPVQIPTEALRAKAVLFQTPDNSPRRTINGTGATTTASTPSVLQTGNCSDSADTMETL